jgi:hypothetical protein
VTDRELEIAKRLEEHGLTLYPTKQGSGYYLTSVPVRLGVDTTDRVTGADRSALGRLWTSLDDIEAWLDTRGG